MKNKRLFDLIFSFSGLIVFGLPIFISLLLATVDTKSFGIFAQKRIGLHGKPFKIFKIKTIHDKTKTSTALGHFFRSSKLDELPQLLNILLGDMSFVGPRPDVPGYADKLDSDDAIILNIRPGLTSPSSLKYRKEEQLLKEQAVPLQFNDTVIWPDKVRINKWYVENQTFLLDLKILWYTLLPNAFDLETFIAKNSLQK